MAAFQAPPSLGFSRQEHWSGLPFPSPMHESEKWKWSCSVMFDSSRPRGLQPTRLLYPRDFPGKSTGVGGAIAFSRDKARNVYLLRIFLKTKISSFFISTVTHPSKYLSTTYRNVNFHYMRFHNICNYGLGCSVRQSST